ncbi:CDP-diacylglycerol--serine O-phosphatidyltransferase [Candidatus Endobugula sertula]|uniref:CDP-diacylglycerol--serine O-phosphatidyltransferase n=1 Tax=Candidatus Endobugula sertula TaxID=62101 RepID=A0A1D2QQY7_9GAMM|nr:CDP-diacylglycerol--serine O-phosphatidyltransferase [Candidatus Endobugula sertula]
MDDRLSQDVSDPLPVDEHVEEVFDGGKKVSYKKVYLLPNLFTTGALFSGFYAIIVSMLGQFEAAAIAIFAAMILDGLDGRVARLTNTSSSFGLQYDSLADMVSFGVAPAIVVLNWGLLSLGKMGWAVSFAYTACAALRLARFNTQTKFADKRFFIGLASPAAAAMIASIVWVWHDVAISMPMKLMVAFSMIVLGLLMVSNLTYNSFKGIDLKGRVSFAAMLLVIFIFVLVVSNPSVVLLVIALLYSLSGPSLWIWQRIRSAKA